MYSALIVALTAINLQPYFFVNQAPEQLAQGCIENILNLMW